MERVNKSELNARVKASRLAAKVTKLLNGIATAEVDHTLTNVIVDCTADKAATVIGVLDAYGIGSSKKHTIEFGSHTMVFVNQ